ncbi:MAG: alkaline phosphatase [Elusimicrobiota bacterium]|jgi:alkaline phosphatase|nr:alkaline phosphatase [Elusimicrobiota bacterium]
MVSRKFFVFFAVLFFAAAQLLAAPAAQKNVILVIGDGAGPAVMAALMQYAKLAPASPYQDRLSNLEKIMKAGSLSFVFNTPVDTVAVDSAASGTQLAAGVKTYPTAIGVDAQGGPVDSILEKAKKAGYGTGLVTTVYLQDATPAVFAAHRPSRKYYHDIAVDMLKTKPDIMLGGGLNYYVSKNNLKDSKYNNIFEKVHYAAALEPQSKDDGLFEQVLKSGYQLVFDKKSLLSAKGPRLLGLFAPQALPFVIDRKPAYPLLKDMAQKALDILAKNEKGFFLMIEGGLIDWAAHNNDQGAVLKELLEFDEALAVVADFAAVHPGTLVIITADHDTGGFAFNYRYLSGAELEQKKQDGYPLYEDIDYVAFQNLDKIAAQTKSFDALIKAYAALPAKNKNAKTIQKIVKDATGIDLPEGWDGGAAQPDIKAALARATEMLGVAWATQQHTAEPVLAVFTGPGGGPYPVPAVMHSTQINNIMEKYLL